MLYLEKQRKSTLKQLVIFDLFCEDSEMTLAWDNTMLVRSEMLAGSFQDQHDHARCYFASEDAGMVPSGPTCLFWP